jgi:hypothetical protein
MVNPEGVEKGTGCRGTELEEGASEGLAGWIGGQEEMR